MMIPLLPVKHRAIYRFTLALTLTHNNTYAHCISSTLSPSTPTYTTYHLSLLTCHFSPVISHPLTRLTTCHFSPSHTTYHLSLLTLSHYINSSAVRREPSFPFPELFEATQCFKMKLNETRHWKLITTMACACWYQEDTDMQRETEDFGISYLPSSLYLHDS